MTKTIIIIGSILGVLLVTGVILALVAPKRISVKNSQFIKASKAEVFNQLRFMKNFPNWSPFKAQDPEQKFNISGNDGQIGATFSWEGVKEKSKGSQTITALKEHESVEIKCNITVPFEAKPTFNYHLIEKNGGVELVQNFESEMPIPSNIFGMLFGLKNKISETNKQGLDLLKKLTEKQFSEGLVTQ
jgi:hypothetical protein